MNTSAAHPLSLTTPLPRYTIVLIYCCSFLLLGASLTLAWWEMPWWGAALGPVIILLPLCFLAPEIGWWAMLLATPFSLEISVATFGAAVQFPTELIILVTLLFWIPQQLARMDTHVPLTLLDGLVLAFLGSAFLSITVSHDWIVSVKGVLNLCWYVGVGYFMTSRIITTPGRVRSVVMIFVLLATAFGLAGIFLYVQNIGTYFQEDFGRQLPEPFFVEHGTYAAYLTFGFSVAYAHGLRLRGSLWRSGMLVASLALLVAIVFSGTRGAWLGAIVPVVVISYYHLLRGARPFRVILGILLALTVAIGLYVYIVSGAISTHAASIFNTSTNLSNLERLNRWVAALHMWEASPVLGHGWGMYIQHYAAYRDMGFGTPLSWERMGAHSEFLTLLAETGLVGLLTFCGIGWFSWRTARRIRRTATDPLILDTALGLIAGLFAYYIHGLFNNYLAFDKVAVPFWVSIGLLAALRRMTDRHRERQRDAG